VDQKSALILTDSVVEATRLAMMEMRQTADGKEEGGDDEEKNRDSKLFNKKRSHGQMHGKGFAKSFAKKK